MSDDGWVDSVPPTWRAEGVTIEQAAADRALLDRVIVERAFGKVDFGAARGDVARVEVQAVTKSPHGLYRLLLARQRAVGHDEGLAFGEDHGR